MERVIRVRKERGVSQSNTELPAFFDSIFVKLILFGISIFILWSVYNSGKITLQKLDILKQAEREVEELRIQNLHLSLSILEMSTDKYLEKEARNRLNFGGEGEIVFVIPENVLEQSIEEVRKETDPLNDSKLKREFTLDSWLLFLTTGI